MLPLFDRATRLPVLLQDALDRGAVVVTANLRAARALQAAYAEDQRSLGILAWPRPPIVDWNSWVSGLWEQYARLSDNAPMPLTAMQEHQLWKQVQGSDRDRVVAPDRMADLAQEAYSLLSSYRAHPLRREAGAAHEDAERFLAWADSFDRTCQRDDWVSRTRLEEILTGHLDLLDPIPELCLVGFDRTTPAQLALLDSFKNTRLTRHAPPSSDSKPSLLPAKDPREELEACAWWCRGLLEEDSTRRIGVIAPDLGRVRADLDRVFRRILMPQTTLWAHALDPTAPYEFSLGSTLATLPVIRAALLLLRWLDSPLASSELTWLLTSGFLAASPADQLALARLDRELRRESSPPEVSLTWLLQQSHRNLPGPLRARLLRVQARSSAACGTANSSAARNRATYAHWAELAPALLNEAGWPGYREQDSFTYQTEQRWTRLLAELAELGFDGSQPTWRDFFSTLDAQAHAVTFAAESTAPPIQILGAFESSGQSFDALWFLGTDAQHWPAVGRPHPLLPAWLQREAKMPHASPQADWLLAEEATARILSSAPVVVVSYPLQDQAIDLRPSPLLLAHTRGAAPPFQQAAQQASLKPVQLESIPDDSGVIAWPAAQPAGGAEILRLQAACGFRSFATRRLRAEPLETAIQGLDAADRGIQLHAVLERLWSTDETDPQRLHTLDDLRRAAADGTLANLLAHHIAAVLTAERNKYLEDNWTAAYLACEQQRLHERLLAWLDCEQTRQPFTVVKLEEKVETQVAGLHLKLRIDRADQLADGSHLLIDYKTGTVDANSWMGIRPKEPQLPLYAIFGGIEKVSGVAFAQIRAEATRLVPCSADPSLVDGSQGKALLFDEAVREGWRQTLLALADQFLRGEAAVNPRKPEETCKYCPLSGLCRVHATGLLQDDDDQEEDSSHE